MSDFNPYASDEYNKAKAFERGAYFTCGSADDQGRPANANYVATVKRVFWRAPGMPGGAHTFVAEFRITESDNPNLPAGTDAGYVIPLGNPKTNPLGNIKGFLAKLSGLSVADLDADSASHFAKDDPDASQRGREKTEAERGAIQKALTGDANPLEGTIVQVRCTTRWVAPSSKGGKDYPGKWWEERAFSLKERSPKLKEILG